MTEFILTAGATVLLLIAEHYFPWRKLLKRDLPKLAAYAMGTFALIAPPTVALTLASELHTLALIWVCVIVGGLTTGACYLLDHAAEMVADAHDTAEREKALRNATSHRR